MSTAEEARHSALPQAAIDGIAAELAVIRREVEDSLGDRDATYIRRTVTFQRILDIAARVVIFGSRSRSGFLLGTFTLAVAKVVENMELGHNIGHGQWDWMNDPEIHSSTWEWDMVAVSAQWRYSHNYRHHVFTNVVSKDDDLGFGIMRITRDEPWTPAHLAQPFRNILLAVLFEWGIALHGLYAAQDRVHDRHGKAWQTGALLAKIRRQLAKDYLLTPALSGRRWRRTLLANAAANILRNIWAYTVIVCGHLPDAAEKFPLETLDDESRSAWYVRQILGTANFRAGPILAFTSGHLCYQIEHHLFPDLPSNRHREIADRVATLCADYGLPYHTGSLARQFLAVQGNVLKLALPDRFLHARVALKNRPPLAKGGASP